MNLEFKPSSNNAATKLVVFLHGLGSDGQDLISLAPYFAKEFPDFHFYSPNGVEKCDMVPYGYQWFSLRNRDPHIIANELDRVSPLVLNMIEEKLNELSLTFEDLILIGFSQGTMLSLYITHANEMRIGALVGFSGVFFPPKVIKNNKTPVCLIHGTADEVVSFDSLKHSKERLEKIGAVVETFSSKNLGHSIDLAGLKFASDFLKKNIK